MIIIKPSNAKKWWDGLILTCSKCDISLMLEIGDISAVRKYITTANRDDYWITCPCCEQNIDFTKP